MSKTVPFQTIHFSISTHFKCQKTASFQIIQLYISTQFSSIWPIDWTLSGTTTLGQSGSESNGNERLLHIPQSSIITGTSTLGCLVSYPGHSLGEGVLPLWREAFRVFYSHSRLGKELSGGLTLKFVWQQDSSGLLVSSQYSSWS